MPTNNSTDKADNKTILAIETCSEICSVALYDANSDKHYSEVIRTPRMHSKRLLPMCEDLLKQANLQTSDIELIGVTQGPGAFTGIRIGAGAAKGMAYALDIPIAGVSTLKTLAMQALHQQLSGEICVLMDARMGEVYTAKFRLENNTINTVDNDKLAAIDTLDDLANTTVIGNAIHEYSDYLATHNITTAEIYNPLAEDIIRLIQHNDVPLVSAAEFSPVYLRNKVVD